MQNISLAAVLSISVAISKDGTYVYVEQRVNALNYITISGTRNDVGI